MSRETDRFIHTLFCYLQAENIRMKDTPSIFAHGRAFPPLQPNSSAGSQLHVHYCSAARGDGLDVWV